MAFWIVTQQDLFFLHSALDLARLASTLPAPPRAETDRRQACVLGSIICSVSFLECSINGLYDHAKSPAGRPTKLHRALASVWSEGFDRQPILAKCQIALALAKRETFRAEEDPYKSANKLIDLRNAIAHPKELIESQRRQQKLESGLNGMFTFNPKRESYKEFFPDRCLSVDGALWALETVTNLSLEFRQRMPPSAYGLPQPRSSAHEVLKEVHGLRAEDAIKRRRR
jgi:hypothetical protein